MPSTAAPAKKSNVILWVGVALAVLLLALFAVAQFNQTLSGILGGDNITSPNGTQSMQSDLQRLGLERVSVNTQGNTTTIAFALPANPEKLLEDKALLAGIALKVNAIPDDQILVINPDGYDAVRTTGKQAKALLQRAIASGGTIDPAALSEYIEP